MSDPSETRLTRRQALTASAVLATGAIAGCSGDSTQDTGETGTDTDQSGSSGASDTAWRLPAGSPARTRSTSATAIGESVSEQWTATPSGYSSMVSKTPLVADTGIFANSGGKTYGVGWDGSNLFEENVTFGSRRVVHNQTLIGCIHNQTKILGLDTTSGERQWVIPLSEAVSRPQPPEVFLADGKLIVIYSYESEQGKGTKVKAIDPGTQETVWTEENPAGEHSAVWFSPVVHPERGHLYLADLSVTSGWNVRLRGEQYLTALSLADGSQEWRTQFHAYPLATKGNQLIAGLPGQSYDVPTGGLVSLSIDDGSEQWRVGSQYGFDRSNFGGSNFYTNGGVALDDNHVYVASGGQLSALERDSGTQVWEYPSTKQFKTPPVVTTNSVLVGEESTVHVVRKSDGNGQTTIDVGTAIDGAPTVGGGRLFVSSDRGLVAFS
jgi:outer membrane protein assembly factor BamB